MTLLPAGARRTRLDLPAGPLHVTELGPRTGHPLVFLHGVLAGSRLWADVASRLASHHRCVLLDLPLGAHPEAMRPDADLTPAGVVALVLSALDALSLPSVTLVGNDSGGALCQLILAEHPARVHSAVLTSCDAYDVWLPALFKPFELLAFVPGGLFVVAQLLRVRAFRRLPFALGWLARRMPEDVAEAFVAPLARERGARRDLAKFLRALSPRLTTAAARSFPSFARPVLVCWSREDRFFPASLARRLAEALPKAELTFVDDAYTFSPLDQPELVAQRIDAFVRRSLLDEPHLARPDQLGGDHAEHRDERA